MVLLDNNPALAKPDARAYLASTELLESLEMGMQEMLVKCVADPDGKRDPINFLASWLMRHNPRHDPAMAALVAEAKAAAREAAAKAKAEAEAAEAAAKAATRSFTAANGEEIELEPDEEVKGCLRCHKAFITLSGKTICIKCRDELDIDTDAGEELKECLQCRNAFITTSGKSHCLKCRKLAGEVDEPAEDEAADEGADAPASQKKILISAGDAKVELEEGEQLAQCQRCSKSFITLSGKTLCVGCREEFMQLVATIDREAGEELKACTDCKKLFVTTSGKDHCLACRGKNGTAEQPQE